MTGTFPEVRRTMAATPQQVFDVLADGWLLPLWVVGATHMRDVDRTWPEPGSRAHHQVGAWPVTVSDDTEVVGCDPPHRLVLRARVRPLGEAHIELHVTDTGGGSEVRIVEQPVRGPGRWVDNPLQRRLLVARNRETLDRLAAVVENRGR